MFKDKNEFFIKASTAIVPGVSAAVAWFLVFIGKSEDYVNEKGEKS
jgi:hypothetical protein